MNDTTVVYSNYNDSTEAHVIKTRLAGAGFACFLVDENVASINQLYNQAIGGVKLIVFEKDVDEINKLLGENNNLENIILYAGIEHGVANEESNVCPKCGTQYSYQMQSRNNKFSLFGFFNFRLARTEKKKCVHCGYEFV